MRGWSAVGLACCLTLCLGFARAETPTRTLSFEDRVDCALTLARLDLGYQIDSEPSLDEAALIEAVTNATASAVRRSIALSREFGETLDAATLQAELERMARRSRLPERLRTRFAVLGNDPYLLQECIARPVLSERRLRAHFADERDYEQWGQLQLQHGDPRQLQVLEQPGFTTPTITATESGCPDDSWQRSSLDEVPDPRHGATAVWTGSLMLVWGGYTGSGPLDTGGRYDPAIDSWSPITRVGAPPPRYWHTAVWTGNELIVWGGWTQQGGAPTDTGARYNPLTDSWTALPIDNAPAARRGHTAVWTGSQMLVWGGHQELIPSGGRYSPATDRWEPITQTNAPSARHGHTAVWTGTRMIVWGGQENFLNGSLLATGAQYDPASDSWSNLSSIGAPSARRDHSAVWTGSAMLIWGGNGGENTPFLRSGARYSPGTNAWAGISLTNAPTERRGHTAVWSGQRMLVWGGLGPPGPLNTGGRYDPAANSWTAITTTNAPTPRDGQVGVWSGSRLIVWGGSDDRITSSGGRYDPTLDSWAATTVGDGPGPRRDHTAVWTGTQMIVWGGYHSDYLATGRRYDPALDAWLAVSNVAAPSPRMAHSATWAGNRMLIWGGQGATVEQTGASYDPLLDTWTPLPTLGAPSARRDHRAVWTGQELLIWGGSYYDAQIFQQVYLGDGKRYNPQTQSWQPISSAQAPTARRLHSATWTGSEVVVWGGLGPGGHLADGARYDLDHDLWIPINPVGAPAAREDHSAVWTGSELLVWGGAVGGQASNDGARYRPADDSWQPISALNAPSPRLHHAAVWTGAELLVWGGWRAADGVNPAEYLGDGKRYDPVVDAWSNLSDIDPATARQAHVAVFDGAAMLVFGGEQGIYGATGTGAQYCACIVASFFPDLDGDGFGDPEVGVRECAAPAGYVANNLDCRDDDPQQWSTPDEVTNLQFVDSVTLSWSAPNEPGALTWSYDLLRTTSADDFVGLAQCVASGISAGAATDTGLPAPATAYFYLARARNNCPRAAGSLGRASNGVERVGRGCP
jgi:N-acetylneuraminic acid mutarotase